MKKRLLFFLLLLAPLGVQALTLSQIRTEVRVRIKDSDATRRRWSDAQLLTLINQTQRDVVNLSWIVKKNTDLTLVVGTTYYSIPSDTIAIERVTMNNKNLPETTLQELDSRFNGGTWPLTTGTPDRYLQDPSQPSKIGVYPWPNSSSSTGTLHVIYFAQAPDLSLDSDEPFNGDDRYTPYHDLLIYEPAYKIMVIEGETEKATEFRAYYEARVKVLLDTVNNKVNYIPGFAAQRK